eukprot:5648350-Pyramimonas_sp.AAC.1
MVIFALLGVTSRMPSRRWWLRRGGDPGVVVAVDGHAGPACGYGTGPVATGAAAHPGLRDGVPVLPEAADGELAF